MANVYVCMLWNIKKLAFEQKSEKWMCNKTKKRKTKTGKREKRKLEKSGKMPLGAKAGVAPRSIFSLLCFFFRFFAFSFYWFSLFQYIVVSFLFAFSLRILASLTQSIHTNKHIYHGIPERKYSSKARGQILGRRVCHANPPNLCLTLTENPTTSVKLSTPLTAQA